MLSRLKEKRDQNRNSEKGFTLVELAIVLVIAGIILVGVMKGTDAVNKAKVERMVSDMRGLAGTLQEYEKRTGRVAGDCDNNGIIENAALPLTTTALNNFAVVTTSATDLTNFAPARVMPATAVNGAGINNTVCVTSASAEADSNQVWNELRRAGVVDANRLPRELARHVMNDVFMLGTMSDATNSAHMIVVYGVPVWMAEAIDASMDGAATMYGTAATGDGPANTGRIRLWAGTATSMTAGTAAAPHLFTANAATNSYDESANDRDRLVSISYQYSTNKLIK